MDAELLLIIGCVVAFLSLPAMVSAYGAGRPPRAAAVTAVIGGAMIVAATVIHPGGFRLNELPEIAARVMDRYVN
ncbi:MAG: hypothetical protein N2422_06780 [Rhodobacteraceae bacterium]|nr:hypothetical protein [Paracoccaceae bacterium]